MSGLHLHAWPTGCLKLEHVRVDRGALATTLIIHTDELSELRSAASFSYSIVL